MAGITSTVSCATSMDSEGKPTLRLESTMKLWWPHTEAIYALVLAYTSTSKERWLRWLERVDKYAFCTFVNPVYRGGSATVIDVANRRCAAKAAITKSRAACAAIWRAAHRRRAPHAAPPIQRAAPPS